jgi:DNA-binding TFAR19-related protein (PDSD5 family)
MVTGEQNEEIKRMNIAKSLENKTRGRLSQVNDARPPILEFLEALFSRYMNFTLKITSV